MPGRRRPRGLGGVHQDTRGLPPVSFHDLRHVAASNLQARGLTLVEVQAILGHASVTTTANVYSHASDDEMARKVRGLAW